MMLIQHCTKVNNSVLLLCFCYRWQWWMRNKATLWWSPQFFMNTPWNTTTESLGRPFLSTAVGRSHFKTTKAQSKERRGRFIPRRSRSVYKKERSLKLLIWICGVVARCKNSHGSLCYALVWKCWHEQFICLKFRTKPTRHKICKKKFLIWHTALCTNILNNKILLRCDNKKVQVFMHTPLILYMYLFLWFRLAVSVTVNLAYSGSPQVSMLPVVYLASGSVDKQGFFYPAISPTEDPLSFSFGNSIDYRSSQAGTPQVEFVLN